MSDIQESLTSYLEKCCDLYGFESCTVATGDGFLLASAGEDMGDEFIALLPKWLRLGQTIGETTAHGRMSCCCMVPENKTSLLLAWKVQDGEAGELFFAALTKRLPSNTVATLKKMSDDTLDLL